MERKESNQTNKCTFTYFPFQILNCYLMKELILSGSESPPQGSPSRHEKHPFYIRCAPPNVAILYYARACIAKSVNMSYVAEN